MCENAFHWDAETPNQMSNNNNNNEKNSTGMESSSIF